MHVPVSAVWRFLKKKKHQEGDKKRWYEASRFCQGIHETKLHFSWVMAQVQNIYPSARHSKQIFLPPCRVFQVFCHHLRGWTRLFFARGVKISPGLGENVYVLNTEVPFTDKMGLSLWCGSRRSCRFFFMASLALYSQRFNLYSYNYNNKGLIHENITQRTVLKRQKVAVQHESSCDKEFVYNSLTNFKK